MIAARSRVIVGGFHEYLAVGPVPVGFVIRGVWVLIAPTVAGGITLGFVQMAAFGESADAMQGGDSLVGMSEVQLPNTTVPGVVLQVAVNASIEFTLPVFVPVRTAGLWVGVGCSPVGTLGIVVGLIVEPERVVMQSRVSAGTPAARRGDVGVMASLRDAAMSAVGER